LRFGPLRANPLMLLFAPGKLGIQARYR